MRPAEPAVDAAYRAALERRLAALDAAAGARIAPRLRPDLVAPPAPTAPAPAPAPASTPSPLAALVQAMRQRATDAPGGDAAEARNPWARLSVQRELAQAAAARPDQAGPLNSHALALRTLQALQRLAPGYLDRLVGQLEALRWLEDARPRRR